MNVHAPIDPVEITMTSEGQIVIPEALRLRAGLVPDRLVRAAVNDRGEVILTRAALDETPGERRARIEAAIEAVKGTVDFGFATTDEYMDFIRPHRLDPE